jgi:hypothetical protein
MMSGGGKTDRRPSLGIDDSAGRNALRVDHHGTNGLAYQKILLNE